MAVSIVSNGQTVTAGGGCNVSAYTPEGAGSKTCDYFYEPNAQPGFSKADQVEFDAGVAQASYVVSAAEFGHLGAAVASFAQSENKPFGFGLQADAFANLSFTDTISISSGTLPYGSVVDLTFSYHVVGAAGANMGPPDYIQHNAVARATGNLSLGKPGQTPVAFSIFCLSTFPSGDCNSTPSKESLYETNVSG
ncbi:MAG: hypothetical protein H7255_10425 [Ramlibacter sp.]|nr:hypothetical protein [Ramlibacter sp.]